MEPASICMRYLGREKLDQVIHELSMPQIKLILKEGGIKPKSPGSLISPKRRRELTATRIRELIAQGNDEVAAELLQQWLLNHRRPMLVAYLEALEVPHRAGETDQSFLLNCPAETARAAALELFQAHDPAEVAAYLTYVAFQQRCTTFEDWEPLTQLAGAAESSASEVTSDSKTV